MSVRAAQTSGRINVASTISTFDTTSRIIKINRTQPEVFVGNRISTAKYTAWTFLPSFLFEQFRRYSNIFFLMIVLLQQIPDVSPTGRYATLIPLTVILCVSAVKEIIEDRKRHNADNDVNNRTVEVLTAGQWTWTKWQAVCVGDFVKVNDNTFFPADIILYSTSDPQGLCYIETSNLDGETNLKIRQGLTETAGFQDITQLTGLSGYIECEAPNRHLYEFAGTLNIQRQDHALGPDQILLRGSKLKNTGWIIGQVVFTGSETKLMKNSTAAPLKRSTLDKRTNKQIVMLFFMLLFIVFISTIFSKIFDGNSSSYAYPPPTGATDNSHTTGPGSPTQLAKTGQRWTQFVFNFFTFFILYNNLIPISLTVTLEVVRYVQASFINSDAEMYHAETDTPAIARTSNLNEELGQIKFIFSDKTGTLTQNIMEFKGCSIGGNIYNYENLFLGRNELVETMNSGDKSSKDIRDFLTLLAVCHTVIPDRKSDGPTTFQASSPDERALVDGARKLGYAFESRTPSTVVINANGSKETYGILTVLDFTSTRKRMSVIVRTPEGKIRMFCKGADSVIYERLAKDVSGEKLSQITEDHLEDFARQGLRTLCCAVKDIEEKDYEDWRKLYHVAATSIQQREEKVELVADQIERNFHLIGATAIEDKLQDHVPETIESLLEAGIKLWVLTGDKQTTAINIGYSCRLLDQSMDLLVVNCETFEETRTCILKYIQQYPAGRMKSGPAENNAAVIVDGKTLKFALDPELRRTFLRLCCFCKSVICCRASPIQKAEIVEYVTDLTGEITLAIGDGANDVAMIQKAHVGVGINGLEGRQAALASDYAIGQFRFLIKLLFVHGAWNYDRMCKLIFYSYYKNMCLYIIELWFAIYSAWSGQVLFERWTIGFYNMLFTCAQPLTVGIFDRNCSKEMRLKHPQLYNQYNDSFSMKLFFAWCATAILHSMILFWYTKWIYHNGVVWESGMEGGYLVLGNFVYTYVVIVVSIKSGLITNSWTIFTHLSIWGSILFWILFLLLYSVTYAIFPFGAEIVGIGPMVFSSPVFYLGLVVIPIGSLLPDLAFGALKNLLDPPVEERFRMMERFKDDPSILFSQMNESNPAIIMQSESLISEEPGSDLRGFPGWGENNFVTSWVRDQIENRVRENTLAMRSPALPNHVTARSGPPNDAYIVTKDG